MTDIQVLIQGLVLLVSSGVYQHGLSGTGAAVAVHSAGRPGKYGVDLPQHKAELLVEKEPVVSSDPPLTDADLDASGLNYVIPLAGQRIQVGSISGKQCKTDSPLTTAGAGGALRNTPSLGDLSLPSTRISTDARPSSTGKYDAIDPNRVDGWLELLGGTLADDTPTGVMAELRPPATREYETAVGAKWTRPAVNAPCLLITSFRTGAQRIVVFDPGAPTVKMTFHSLPMTPQNGHRHGRPGVSYDFELLYDLFDQKPAIPPVPHLHLPAKVAGLEAEYLRECALFCVATSKPTGDPVSGINCIDGFVPDPGDP
jgi:hypothetical protein